MPEIRFTIRTLFLITFTVSLLVLVALRLVSDDDSTLVRQLKKLENKSVAQFRDLLSGRREIGVMLEPLTSDGQFTFNGYIVYTSDERAVKLYIDPVVYSPNGMFEQSQLDECRIDGIQVVAFPRYND